MRILITGGAGYIGYSLVQQLLKHSSDVHSITIYDNLSRRNFAFFTEARFDHRPVHFIQKDILDGRSLTKAVTNADCVVHLAAKVTTPFADAEAHFYDQINHWGSAHLADVLEQHPVSRLIYLSSVSVYGSSLQAVDESASGHPISFYGISKLNGEKQLRRLAQKTDLFILRSGNVYGYNPSYRIDAVINRFLFEANFHNRITINGDGNQFRSFIHVEKLAHIIRHVIEDKLDPGTYNIAEHNMTINDVAAHVGALYPEMEIMQSNLSMPLRNIKVQTPCKIFTQIPYPEKSFAQELASFKDHFSF